MKERFIDLFYKWPYANQNMEFFKKNKDQINIANSATLKNISGVATVYLGIFCIMGLINEAIQKNIVVYAVNFLISLGFYIVCRFLFVELKFNFSNGICYIFSALLYCFSIYIGCFNDLYNNAVMLPVLLISIPLLFVVPPFQINLFSWTFAVIYMIIAYYVKPLDVVKTDLTNIFACILIGSITSYTMISVRIKEINSTRVLEDACNIDDLTGLQNRRSFNRYIIKSFEEDLNNKISIMMIDIDNFKSYNDTYGHIYGDTCLEAVGKLLSEFCNRHNSYIARYGGEEFILVDKKHNIEEVQGMASELLDCIFSMDIENANSKYNKITISIGISSRQISEVDSYIGLINLADDALYQAKENGKNSIMLGTHALCGFEAAASTLSV